jgi:ferrous iron transport protein A
MEMGLVEGAEVRVVRRAPLGDPMQVRVGDYDLSLRASEARLIGVAAL